MGNKKKSAISELFCANHTLYLVGAMEHTEYSTTPSSNLYSIDLDELKKQKLTTLNSPVNRCKRGAE
jgi:hypothetical protein